MITHFLEVTNNDMNWGKFMLGRFTQEEWDRESVIMEESNLFTSLLRTRGWCSEHVLVLDLETGEGAIFLPLGSARADLNKHKVWVCPMFEPFLEWLYEQSPIVRLTDLPSKVNLPDAPFAMVGYRREGK